MIRSTYRLYAMNCGLGAASLLLGALNWDAFKTLFHLAEGQPSLTFPVAANLLVLVPFLVLPVCFAGALVNMACWERHPRAVRLATFVLAFCGIGAAAALALFRLIFC